MKARNRMQSIAGLLTLALLVGGAAQAAAEPSAGRAMLKPEVEISDPLLRLSDLFAPVAPEADRAVARAPEPGRKLELGARWLATVAQGHGIDWQPTTRFDRVVVTRSSTAIEAPAIQTALRDALDGQNQGQEFSVLLDDPTITLHLPLGSEATLGISGLSYNPSNGRFRAKAVAPADAPIAEATVTGRAVAMVDMPVPRRRIMRGEIIRADDLQWRRVPADRLAADALIDPAAVLGKSPRRALKTGEPVRSGQLQEPVLVPKNALVTLRLATERMVLTAQGRALEPGTKGEVIRVMNTQSRTIVNGTVLASGAVAVPHPAGQPIR